MSLEADQDAITDTHAAEKLASESDFGTREVTRNTVILISGVAAAWSLFQLALPKFLLLGSDYVRSIHLAFAMALVFLSFPALKLKSSGAATSRSWLAFLSQKKLSGFDIFLSGLAALSALYYAIDYSGISMRQGMPITRDLVMGFLLTILLLEAARRSLGPALPLIAVSFIGYSFFSEFMPDILAFKNASLSKVVNKLVMGTEGIYGVPLDVSASTVFLFVLFGAMLEKAGGGKYFIDLSLSLLGKYKGGPGKAAVLASGLMGMISGSSIANTVTTGTFTIPLMKRTGFSGIKAGAIEVAASTNGQLMPPIMGAAAFIIAEYCNLTYFEVVKAAFVPAVVSYLALIYITHLEAGKLGLKGMKKEELPQFSSVFFQGIYFFIPLGFLLFQLLVMRRSAQLSAYYAILVLALMVLMRAMLMARGQGKDLLAGFKAGWAVIWQSLIAGGKNMMSIGVAVGAAGIIVGIVTMGLGGVITDLIGFLSGGNLILLLIITAIASLILGMGLPTTATYIVMASLTTPVIVELSGEAGLVVPLIAAHLFCFYFGILADDTPPVGLAAYAAAAISKEDPVKTGIQGFIYDLRTAILPFMFIFNSDLLLIGISSPLQMTIIFGSATVAMFAFAALTQNYFFAKNRFYESALLIGVTIILLRPDLISKWLDLTKNLCYGLGVALFFIVYFFQRLRVRTIHP